ncbi:MAG: hypothetical protein WCV85_06145 [Patescibacteria group bacterium]|jgi:hypothetical protein
MLNKEEITQLIDGLSNAFATKQDLADTEKRLDEKVSSLISSVDAYAKKADTFFQELVVQVHRVDRHEKWIKQIADKLGVPLQI